MPTGFVQVDLEIIIMITIILKTYVYGAQTTETTDEITLTTQCKTVS